MSKSNNRDYTILWIDDEILEKIRDDIRYGTLEAFSEMDTFDVQELNEHSAMSLDTDWTATTLKTIGDAIEIAGRGTTTTRAYGDLEFTYTAVLDTNGRRYYVNCDADDLAVDVVMLRK